MINPDDVQSPYEHGQLMIYGILAMLAAWYIVGGILWYFQAASRSRTADKERKRAAKAPQ